MKNLFLLSLVVLFCYPSLTTAREKYNFNLDWLLTMGNTKGAELSFSSTLVIVKERLYSYIQVSMRAESLIGRLAWKTPTISSSQETKHELCIVEVEFKENLR